jgi:hypothetical protein
MREAIRLRYESGAFMRIGDIAARVGYSTATVGRWLRKPFCNVVLTGGTVYVVRYKKGHRRREMIGGR